MPSGHGTGRLVSDERVKSNTRLCPINLLTQLYLPAGAPENLLLVCSCSMLEPLSRVYGAMTHGYYRLHLHSLYPDQI